MKGQKGKMTDLENSLKKNKTIWKRTGVVGEGTVSTGGRGIYCLTASGQFVY